MCLVQIRCSRNRCTFWIASSGKILRPKCSQLKYDSLQLTHLRLLRSTTAIFSHVHSHLNYFICVISSSNYVQTRFGIQGWFWMARTWWHASPPPSWQMPFQISNFLLFPLRSPIILCFLDICKKKFFWIFCVNLTESQYVCTILDPLPISGFKTQQTEQNCGKKNSE